MIIQTKDSLRVILSDSIKVSDTVRRSKPEILKIQIVENSDKIDWNIWFLLVAILTLIAAVAIPFLQKKYEERKSKFGFHLYIKKKLGIVWNLLTYDKFEYKHPTSKTDLKEKLLTFEDYLKEFKSDFIENKNTIHPLFAFGILFNLQNLLLTVKRIQGALREIDIQNLDEKTLEFGDKISKKEHHKLNGLYLLIEHYFSITNFHDKFDSLNSIKRKMKSSQWIGLQVESKTLQNQSLIMKDLEYVKENERSVEEIIQINLLLIQELKSYFEFEKLKKKRNKNN